MNIVSVNHPYLVVWVISNPINLLECLLDAGIAVSFIEWPRSPVIPCLGRLHGTLSSFMHFSNPQPFYKAGQMFTCHHSGEPTVTTSN